MKWYNTKNKLPNNGEKVVCYYTFQGDPCIHVMYFEQGISKEERKILKKQGNRRG